MQEYETLVLRFIKTFYFSQIATLSKFVGGDLKYRRPPRLGASYIRDLPSILRFLSLVEGQDGKLANFWIRAR